MKTPKNLIAILGISANLLNLSRGLPSNVDLTDANMVVYNDYADALSITVDGNAEMSHTFPSSSTIQPGSSAGGYVEASNWPGQSSFNLHFDQTHTMNVLIGTGWYTTSASPNYFSDGTGAAVLAPGNPFSTGTDFDFYFFGGPGTIPPLINSFINTNLPAISSSIAKNPVSINITNQYLTNLAITNLNVPPNSLSCAYAALTPKSGASNTTYNANIVCNLPSGEVDGSITVLGQVATFQITLTDATLFVQAQIDLSFTTKPSITMLKCSLGDYTADGNFIDILKDIPFANTIISLGATAYRIAGAINTDLNQHIINEINSALANIGVLTKDSLVKHLSSLISRATASKPRSRSDAKMKSRQLSNLTTWMSTSQIQAKTLSQIKLPGSHDSATYGLTANLSQIQYDDIAFLWSLSGGNAPVDGSWPIPSKPTAAQPWYLGDVLYYFVLENGVKPISQTQDQSVLQQLQGGIRSFDLRVYFDTRDDKFYTQHALRGPAVQDLLNDVKSFIQANPNSQELIFITISHTNLRSHTDQIPTLTSLINSYIPTENLYWQATPQGQSQFDFQSLKDTVLSNITAGATKVMFLNGDTDYTYSDTVTNTPGYAGVTWTHEIYSLADMTANQGPPLQNHTEALWSVGWTLGLSNNDIAVSIINGMRTGDWTSPLKGVATAANGDLQAFFSQYGTKFNLVTVDWEEDSSGQSVAELVIGMNGASN